VSPNITESSTLTLLKKDQSTNTDDSLLKFLKIPSSASDLNAVPHTPKKNNGGSTVTHSGIVLASADNICPGDVAYSEQEIIDAGLNLSDLADGVVVDTVEDTESDSNVRSFSKSPSSDHSVCQDQQLNDGDDDSDIGDSEPISHYYEMPSLAAVKPDKIEQEVKEMIEETIKNVEQKNLSSTQDTCRSSEDKANKAILIGSLDEGYSHDDEENDDPDYVCSDSEFEKDSENDNMEDDNDVKEADTRIIQELLKKKDFKDLISFGIGDQTSKNEAKNNDAVSQLSV